MAKKNKKESKTAMPKTNGSKMGFEELFKNGAEAQASYDYPSAIELYSQALANEEINSELAYEILDERAECFERMGQFKAELDDFDKMFEIAQDLGNSEMQMAIVYRQVFTAARMGENAKVREIAEAAMVTGEKSDDISINAGVKLAVGYNHFVLEEKLEAQDNFEQALRLYRAAGDSEGEANTLAALGSVVTRTGNQVLAGKYALDALAIWQALGNRKREASALNAWSLTTSDYAQKRDAQEEVLENFKTIGDRFGQGQMYNNLSLLYGHLGLYSTARVYAHRAVDMVRETGARYGLALYLDSLARAEMNLGEFARAEEKFQEGQKVSAEINNRGIEGFVSYGMGRVALLSGQAEKGRDAIQSALDIFREINLGSDIPSTLAWLGATYLALDDPQSARMHTAEGVTEQEVIGLGGSEYPPQEIWWWHYQAQTYELRQEQAQKGNRSEIFDIPDNAWAALQKAREITLEGIASLSDEGLRRNYLNKVRINREIIAEWARHAAARNLITEEDDSQPGNVQAQLQRQLAIGVRMNERREIQALTEFVMDELIELSGAERAMLLLVNESGERQIGASYGFPEDEKEILIQASNLIDIVEASNMPGLRQDIDQGDINSTTQDPLKSLSVLCVPLISRGKLSGVIYADNHAIYGKFTQADVDLLASFANQVAAAIENAHLYQGLEQRVSERTAELSASNGALEQRNAELTILNSVGDAMAQKQDVDTITRIVGDRVRDIFKAEATGIHLYDSQNQIITSPYHYDRGYVNHPPFQFGEGLTSVVIETRQPLIFGTSEESNKSGAIRILNAEDKSITESYIGVPIIVGVRVLGVVSVQSYSKHAYDESSVRLLSTLAASMGVAIENARLFEETNRLLVESQQQAAEMATVNTVGQALTSELEMEALIELIGEQVRQIFSADITYVALYDRQTNLIEFPYAVGDDLESLPYGEGLTSKIIESGQPLLINEEVNERVDEIGASHSGADVQSYLGVPILVGKQAIGVISVQSMKEVGHFEEDDVRLLSTIAANVGAALRNAQLYQETQQRADEMAALTEIGREISATLDLENVLERIATRAKDLLNARTATIRLLEEDGSLPTVVAIGKYAEKHRGTTIQMGEGITGNVAKTGKAEIINDSRQDRRMVHVPGTPDDLEAIIFAPLMIGERVTGVMGLWRDKPVAGPFSQDDLRFLESLARQAANAIENARLFEEVQRQKLYSEALVQNSPVAIVTTDLENMVVSWNPAAENLFGYQADEAIGVNILDLISKVKADEEMSNIFKQLKDGGRVKTVTQRFRKDGSTVDVELLALEVLMEGKQVGLVAIYHDITELLRARHEAEAANEAKSAFLATMSHEIRTPMNGVIGMTSLLLDTELDSEQRDFTETIRNSGEALLTVINDILDFSKIEAGKMELEEQPFDLRDCLESSLDLLKLNASEKGVELAYQMNPDVPPVIVGDITRLRQVLINLLNNGLKFTEQGEVVLSVATEAVPVKPDGPYSLRFSVCDTGIGIPPDRVDRLFQAFSQVDASTSRKYGGTGLGLAISKRLSELMGGDMWVESVIGVGTTFHFTIAAPAGPDLKDRAELKGEQPQLRGKRLLIVDDNRTNRRILTLQTRAWGMLPRDTGDPSEALKWVRQGDPFDLAILDFHMPEMDGIELSRAIRDHRQAADLPLVLFSSISAREMAMEEDQFAAFLMKPLKPSVLLNTLMNLFAGETKRIEPEEGSGMAKLDSQLAEHLPLRILLVEDNAVNQKLALRLLEQMGYRADLAGNGLEAIQAVSRQKYDVVLMDVQMPEMDGLEASRRICARWSRGERPRIVAMTANAMQGDRERCLEAGMDDYVSKPIRVNELAAALGKAKPIGIPGEEIA